MNTLSYEILIIGGGAAGMAAALAAENKGYRRILIAERGSELGGILLQCTHTGFGMGYFQEDLTGTEYAARFRERIRKSCAEVRTDTMVLKLGSDRTALLSGKEGVFLVRFGICVLASGCREKTLYSENVWGSRPAGIMTCGTAQKLMNVDGLDIGNDVLIAGTGNVGQIMAGQLTEAGKRVIAMIEKEASPGGSKRNRERYLERYQIPVITNAVIAGLYGDRRIEGVCIRHLDTGAEEDLACRTLLTAIGMIPERELLTEAFGNPERKLQVGESGNPERELPDWIRVVGNCDYVHEIVDGVTADGLSLF